jgi:hypothetical protein
MMAMLVGEHLGLVVTVEIVGLGVPPLRQAQAQDFKKKADCFAAYNLLVKRLRT